MKPKVLIALNTTWNLVNFRANLIRAMIAEGYEVVAASPPDRFVEQLKALGARYQPLPMDNRGTHPGRDLLLLGRFLQLFSVEQPDVYLGYTVKPNVYGSLAAHIAGVPVINNIAGLGTVFVTDSWRTLVVRALYQLALARSAKVLFQNEEDLQTFLRDGIVSRAVAERIPGSGVDLDRFKPVIRKTANELASPRPQPMRFLLASRLLWDKGIAEFVAAARHVRTQRTDVEFCLLGPFDAQSPAAVPPDQVGRWVDEGTIRYLGVEEDVRTQFSAADCIVLPSFYREGVPRVLLEAAAMGKPIITTDAPGCRDVVDDGASGLLCRARDPEDLAAKIEDMMALSLRDREEMGRRGRAKAERVFDERIVIRKYLETIRSLRTADRMASPHSAISAAGQYVSKICSGSNR